MSDLKTLRKAASCQPNNADLLLWAANEIERLQGERSKLKDERLVPPPPEPPKCRVVIDGKGGRQSESKKIDHCLTDEELNKIKAETIENFIGHLYLEAPYLDSDIRNIGNEFIGRIERGKL